MYRQDALVADLQANVTSYTDIGRVELGTEADLQRGGVQRRRRFAPPQSHDRFRMQVSRGILSAERGAVQLSI